MPGQPHAQVQVMKVENRGSEGGSETVVRRFMLSMMRGVVVGWVDVGGAVFVVFVGERMAELPAGLMGDEMVALVVGAIDGVCDG